MFIPKMGSSTDQINYHDGISYDRITTVSQPHELLPGPLVENLKGSSSTTNG